MHHFLMRRLITNFGIPNNLSTQKYKNYYGKFITVKRNCRR